MNTQDEQREEWECSRCKVKKQASQFGRERRAKNGLTSECKACRSVARWGKQSTPASRAAGRAWNAAQREERHNNPSPALVAKYHYQGMKERGNSTRPAYAEVKCLISEDEFLKWVEARWDEYMTLHGAWKAEGFPKRLSPTVDRLDSKLHYQADNIRWLPFGTNAALGARAPRRRPTACMRGHEYNSINTQFYPAGNRRCRVCDRDRVRRRYWLNKGINITLNDDKA